MKFAKGFTLIELLVTVVILAIIAAVGIPMYGSYVTRGKVVEATNTLSNWRVQMEQYYQDNRTYLNAAGTSCGIAVPTGKYFSYTCPAVAGWYGPAAAQNTYSLVATGGTANDASMSGFQYGVDQQNNKSSNITGAAAAAGWSAANPNNCWVTNKGGKC